MCRRMMFSGVILFFTVSIMLLGVWPVGGGAEEEEEGASVSPDILVMKAGNLYESKKFKEAEKLYEEYLEKAPQGKHREEAAFFRGQIKFLLGDYEGCLEALRPELERSPAYREQLLFYLGESAFLLKRNAEALTYFQWLLQEYPSSAQAGLAQGRIGIIHFRQGNALLGVEDYAAALVHFQQAGSAPAELLPFIAYRTGECLARLGKTEEAEKALRGLISPAEKQNTDLGKVALFRLALLLEEAGKKEEAQKAYQELIASSPEHFLAEPSLKRAAALKAAAGDVSGAMQSLESLGLARDFADQAALYEQGLEHLWHREYPDAERAFLPLAEKAKDPDLQHLATSQLLELYITQERVAEARDLIEEAGKRGEALPDSLLLQAAELQLKARDYKNAEEMLAKVSFQAEPADRDHAAVLAAEILYLQGKLDQAESAFRTFLESNPQPEYAARALYYRGQMNMMRAHPGEETSAAASKDLEQAMDKAKDAELKLAAGRLLVQVYEQEGRLDSALATLDKLAGVINELPWEKEAHKRHKAALLFNKGDYDKGIALYQELSKEAPANRASQYRFEMAWGKYRVGRKDEAREVLQDLVREQGRVAGQAALLLAMMDREEKNYAQALERLKMLADADAQLKARAAWERGLILQEQGDCPAAMKEYLGLKEANPAAGIYTKGRILACLQAQGDTAGYLKELGITEEAGKECLNESFLLEQARGAFERKEEKELAQFSAALFATAWDESAFEEAAVLKAQLEYEKGNRSSALQAMEGVLRLNPSSAQAPVIKFYQAREAYEKGDCEKVIAALGSGAVPAKPRERRASCELMLGDCYAKTGDAEKAAVHYSRLLDSAGEVPISAQQMMSIGLALKKAGKLDPAAQALRQALSMGLEDKLAAEAQYGLAECYQEKGQDRLAAEEYLKIPKNYPSQGMWSTTAKFQAATLLEDLGEYQQAAELYEMVIKESKGDKERQEFTKKHLQQLKKKIKEKERGPTYG